MKPTASKKRYTDFPLIKKLIKGFENVFKSLNIFNRGGGAFASHAEGLVFES